MNMLIRFMNSHDEDNVDDAVLMRKVIASDCKNDADDEGMVIIFLL